MAPKRKGKGKYLSPYEEFLKYSANAHHSVQGVTLEAGRRLGRTRWREISRHATKIEYIAALNAKRVVQDKIDNEEAKRRDIRGEIDALAQQNVTVWNNGRLLAKYGNLHDCLAELDALYDELSTADTRLVNAANAIYTTPAMHAYTAQRHAQVVNAHTDATNNWRDIEGLEDQFRTPETQNRERKILKVCCQHGRHGGDFAKRKIAFHE